MTESTPLQPFVVTVRTFDPGDASAAGAEYQLPVDGPDAEHAVAAAMSNAVAFTGKVGPDGALLPVAFQATDVRPRV